MKTVIVILFLFMISGCLTAYDQSITAMPITSRLIILKATDIDGDKLTYIIVTQPAHGKLTGNGNSFEYLPDIGYSGEDSFSYKVNDGKADSNIATVNIMVDKV